MDGTAIVLTVLAAIAAFEVLVEVLNIRHMTLTLPDKLVGWYDADRYQASQSYLRDNSRFAIIQNVLITVVVLAFIGLGGINVWDQLVRSLGWSAVLTGVLFVITLTLGSLALSLPFSIYKTFVIEARHGFNRATPKTFAADVIKGLVLALLLGTPILAAIIAFLAYAGSYAWAYCWGAYTLFQMVIVYIQPRWLMPIFNKFSPLPEGSLRTRIEAYAADEGFTLEGIFLMDGSKRSTKSNAFFVGVGKQKRIVLFDTLVESHSEDELIAVLAHEVGHYKHGHIRKFVTLSIISSGVMFFLLALCITRPELFTAFRVEQMSVHAGLVLFMIALTPVNLLLGIVQNATSRRFEFQADAYAAASLGGGNALISALKHLSLHNLANPTPHPLKVALQYSHPPVLARVHALNQGNIG